MSDTIDTSNFNIAEYDLEKTTDIYYRYQNIICYSEELNIFCYIHYSVSNNNIVMLSRDNGNTWEEHLLPASTTWCAMCWSSELHVFCAIAGGRYSSDNNTAISSDGVTWTSGNLPSKTDWWSICWSPELGMLCAIGGGTIAATSPDGITWTQRTLPVSANWNSICWSPKLGLFCAVAGDYDNLTNIAVTSPDGITWTQRTLPVSASWNSVCWSPELGKFCIINSIGNSLFYSAYSYDGIKWYLSNPIVVGGYTINEAFMETNIIWSSSFGAFICIDYNYGYLRYSRDGIKWKTKYIRKFIEKWLHMISYNSFICTIGRGCMCSISNNGYEWNDYILDSYKHSKGVCYSDTLGFCYISNECMYNFYDLNGVVSSTTDYIHWVTTIFDYFVSTICWSPYLEKICVAGYSKYDTTDTSIIYLTKDNITYDKYTITPAYSINSICWSPEKKMFCSCGDNNIIYSNSYGTKWTPISLIDTIGSSYSWCSICWASNAIDTDNTVGLFCAVANTASTFMITSPDGINWSKKTIPSSTLVSVCWSPELELICAITNSYALISHNFKDWIKVQLPTGYGNWNSVCYFSKIQSFCFLSESGHVYEFGNFEINYITTTILNSYISFIENGKSTNLTIKVYPDYATYKKSLYFYSSDSSIASVDGKYNATTNLYDITLSGNSNGKAKISMNVRDYAYNYDDEDSNDLLLVHGNSFSDYSADPNSQDKTNRTITNTNVTINTSNSNLTTGSMYFSGNSYLKISPITITNAITLEAWVYLTTYTPSGTNTDCSIIISKTSSYYMAIYNSGYLAFYAYGLSNPGYHLSNSKVPLNKWTHIAVVYDNSNIKFFINGKRDKVISSITGSIAVSELNVYIGGEGNNNFGRYLTKGYIDEVRLSNYARWNNTFTPNHTPYCSVPKDSYESNFYLMVSPLPKYIAINTKKLLGLRNVSASVLKNLSDNKEYNVIDSDTIKNISTRITYSVVDEKSKNIIDEYDDSKILKLGENSHIKFSSIPINSNITGFHYIISPVADNFNTDIIKITNLEQLYKINSHNITETDYVYDVASDTIYNVIDSDKLNLLEGYSKNVTITIVDNDTARFALTDLNNESLVYQKDTNLLMTVKDSSNLDKDYSYSNRKALSKVDNIKDTNILSAFAVKNIFNSDYIYAKTDNGLAKPVQGIYKIIDSTTEKLKLYTNYVKMNAIIVENRDVRLNLTGLKKGTLVYQKDINILMTVNVENGTNKLDSESYYNNRKHLIIIDDLNNINNRIELSRYNQIFKLGDIVYIYGEGIWYDQNLLPVYHREDKGVWTNNNVCKIYKCYKVTDLNNLTNGNGYEEYKIVDIDLFNNTFTAVNEGEIKLTVYNPTTNVYSSMNVYVINQATQLLFDNLEDINLDNNGTATVTAEILPTDATINKNKDVVIQ